MLIYVHINRKYMKKKYVTPVSEVVRLKGDTLLDNNFPVAFSQTPIDQGDINAKQGDFEEVEELPVSKSLWD